MRLFLPIGIALSVGLVVTARLNDFIKSHEMALVAVLILVAIVANIDQALHKPADSEAAIVKEDAPKRRRGQSDGEHDIILVGLGRIEERLSQLEKRHEALASSTQPSGEKLLLEVKSVLAGLRQSAESEPAGKQLPAPVPEDKLEELSGALSEAMKEISRRDKTIDDLTSNVTRANIQRNLARLTQILEVALSLKSRISSGKSDPVDSLDFLVDDMNSALSDQGVEFMEIIPGTKVSELPAGSFAAIAVVDAPEEPLKGTVKEVRSRCYFIPEEGKKPRYVAPAKVVLYRA
jgi:tetrahydromethanopterin S-methyltransferase subunit B